MISSIVSRLVILLFGTLYPAYASYKAVRTKDVKEYVKWMMYWIVFALFTCAETFTDVLLSFWFPFYYEIKIIVVLWLLAPATKGSSIIYRKFVHPTFTKKEKEIDEAIKNAKVQGYSTILKLGARGVDYAKYILMQTAIKGGGGLMNQLRKSYSLSDLSDSQDELKYRAIGLGSLQEEQDVADHSGVHVYPDLQYMRRSYVHPGQRSGSVSSPMEIYFSEVDLDLKQRGKGDRPNAVCLPQSMEDVSSGYSSADHLFSSSQGNSPTSDHTLEDIFLRSAHIKSRRPIYSGNSSSNRSSEGVASLVDELDISKDGVPSQSPFLSHSMLSEIKSLLSSRKGDINKILSSQTPSGSPLYTKVSDSIVTKTNQMRFLKDNDEMIKKNISKGNEGPNDSISMCQPSLNVEKADGSESIFLSDTLCDDSQDFKDKAARAGRYKKLRAPVPPSKSTSDIESMSNPEHGTVVKARMSLVSSRRLSGSVNILVESNARTASKNTKPTSVLLLRRESSNPCKTHSLMKKRSPLHNPYLSMPNLFNLSSTVKPTQPIANSKYMKITKS
ncbi:uncharacterized protein LOC113205458 isoform X1 [Frankliniella occidentalis]|uniref:Uncharacterized protein LOC113205458 isoform X1 n=1 Tax=Frankliniella occidentalis TaxID=133901 RepID=A0A9C6U4W1_FRAOC|nr:uncharacterized protein LOC113205458 isoform X1 [Frankliniella occidentalis]